MIAYYPAKCVLSIIHVYAKRSLAEWNVNHDAKGVQLSNTVAEKVNTEASLIAVPMERQVERANNFMF